MFEVLAREGINIQMISTSEIKISVVVDAKYTELAVRVLHDAFIGNDRNPVKAILIFDARLAMRQLESDPADAVKEISDL